MATSLSNLVDSLSEGLCNYKCTDCKSCLEYMSTEDKLLIFCCLKCNKNHKKPFNKCLIKRFANTYEFCGGDISNVITCRWFSMEKKVKFDESFIKNYYEDSDKEYILEVAVEYLKDLDYLHIDLHYLPERMKINKFNKLVCNLYVVHIRNLKQALDYGLILKKVHKVIQFNQEAWLKDYIDLNSGLRTKPKTDFEKNSLKLMNKEIIEI